MPIHAFDGGAAYDRDRRDRDGYEAMLIRTTVGVAVAGVLLGGATLAGTLGGAAAQVTSGSGSPNVFGVSPNVGPVTGGTEVTITGTSFEGATRVTFGTNEASSFEVISNHKLVAKSPPGTGTVNVRVIQNRQYSAISSADVFTYYPVPTVTGVSPDVGPTTGSTWVTVTGSGFNGADPTMFGNKPAWAVGEISSTQLSAESPPGKGRVNVTVTTQGGTTAISLGDEFTYLSAPTVKSLSPHDGPASGGTRVTIRGTGFALATAVTFGTEPAAHFKVVSPTKIVAISPPGRQKIYVTVTNPGGTSAINPADTFRWY